MTEPMTLEQTMARIADLEASESQLIDERDAAEDALSDMFAKVTGRPAEWSNLWGFEDAVEEAEEHVVRQALRDQEAQIANLKRCVSHECIVAEDHIRIAKESADLLRDVSRYLDPRQFSEVIARITAHLGANHG